MLKMIFRKYCVTSLERRILDAIGSGLPEPASTVWQVQVQAIHLVQRLPDGIEVNFYMRDPADRIGKALPRFVRGDEFVVATVVLAMPTLGTSITANVWSVSGRLFSIEYKGSINYFAEALGMDPEPEVEISVTIEAIELA